jgi:hypothetical protein
LVKKKDFSNAKTDNKTSKTFLISLIYQKNLFTFRITIKKCPGMVVYALFLPHKQGKKTVEELAGRLYRQNFIKKKHPTLLGMISFQ